MTKKTCIAIAVLACVALVMFFAGRMSVRDIEPQTITKHDTLTVYHTERYAYPEPSYKVNLPPVLLPMPVRDTAIVHDSILVEVPMEQKVYEKENYTAYVSGFSPKLDSIRLNIPTTYIENTTIVRKPAPRWSIGIQAGVGAQYGIINRSADFGPYVGVGVSYRFALPSKRK